MTCPGKGTAATGIALALLSAGGFGTSGIFASALISSGWSPAAATMARLVAPAFLLAVPAVLQLRGRWALLRRQASRVVVYGLVAVAGGQLFYFNAIESIPIGIALLLEYLGVVLVVGWLWISRGERPRRLTVIGVLTAIAGLALLIGLAGSSRISPIGIMWGLLDAVSLATYFLVSAGGTGEALPPVVMAWGGMCVGAAFLVIAAGTGLLSVSAHAGDVELLHRHVSWIAPVLELSLVAAVVPYVAGIAAARRLGAKRASFIGIAEVVFAVLYAWLLLGQLPSAMQFTGGAFMLVGVVLVHVDENQQRPANPLTRRRHPPQARHPPML
ncbi:MAG TPA: DMT family transporter [Streptosporangiaceae bacterium]|nr:DMT family transporter [Streptosporangiaceae bacterium]